MQSTTQNALFGNELLLIIWFKWYRRHISRNFLRVVVFIKKIKLELYNQLLDVRKWGLLNLKVLETDRLILRRLSPNDAEFLLRLLNDPSWLKFIGDMGVRTIEDARNYILKGPVEMYSRHGFGLYLVETKSNGVSVGICGLIKRDSLEDVDIGFAFLPEFRNRGYAYEAASATMEYGKETFGLNRLLAITSSDNDVSGKLLEKLGFNFEKMTKLSKDAKEIKLFAIDL